MSQTVLRSTILLSVVSICILDPFGSAHAQQPVSPPTETAAEITRVNMLSDLERQQEILDEFTAECLAESKKPENKDKPSFGCYGRAKLRSSAQARRYFGGLEVGNVVALSVGDDRSTLYTELVSDNLFTMSSLGYARVGFGALVANDDTTETTVQQFFAGGGNGVGYVAVPVYRWVNIVADGTSIRPLRRADLGFTAAVRGDIPALNAAVEDPAGSFYMGGRVDALQHSSTDLFRFFMVADGGWVRGTEAFYDNLDLADVPEWGSLSAKLTAGVDLNQLIRVGISRGWSTLDSVNLPWRLSVQLLPQKATGGQ